jgi:phenylacetic acid degradation operon negative regulatory protein
VGETTGADATDVVSGDPPRAQPDPAGDAISDEDLPTRMLVFGLARHDGTIPAAEVFAVADQCHRSPEQVRSCLRRIVGEGLFERDGVGQRAVYRPTEAGMRALTAFGRRAIRAHVQDTERDGWDGRWHLVAFAVPESKRTARDALRDQLGLLGGAAVHNGLYVSPHGWDDDVAATADSLGVAHHVTLAVTETLSVGGESEPRDLAARLWPLDDLAGRYQAFLDRWSVVLDNLGHLQRHNCPLPDSAYLPGSLAMALAYRDCLAADPLLPLELLPHPWPGRAARDLIVRSRRLALQVRAEADRPRLFATFDDLVDSAVPQGGSQ